MNFMKKYGVSSGRSPSSENEGSFSSQNVESGFNRKFFAMRVRSKNVISSCFTFKNRVFISANRRTNTHDSLIYKIMSASMCSIL
jgi:hypothetical protein